MKGYRHPVILFSGIFLLLTSIGSCWATSPQQRSSGPAAATRGTTVSPRTSRNTYIAKLRTRHTASMQRDKRIGTLLRKLEQLGKQPVPAGLSRRQLLNWNAQTALIKRIYARVTHHRTHTKQLIKRSGLMLRNRSASSRQRQGILADMKTLNKQFLALQNAVQIESRKFQTLSNASRARHDIMMSSIRNIRA